MKGLIYLGLDFSRALLSGWMPGVSMANFSSWLSAIMPRRLLRSS